MELFHFYYDGDEESVYFPVVRTKQGYGIFYWKAHNGLIRPTNNADIRFPAAYFENGTDSVPRMDAGLGRWGKSKLEIADGKLEFFGREVFIVNAFENPDFIRTWEMWVK